MLEFEILARDGAARRGVIRTSHGELETPGFLAVATRAALKGLDPRTARAAGVEALICNGYHLAVQPGPDLVAAAGGLHRFMAWDGVLATDSGGFQVFSLRHGQVADELKGRRRLPAATADEDPLEAVRVDERGADFRSYLDGSRHRFTPESNMALQRGRRLSGTCAGRVAASTPSTTWTWPPPRRCTASSTAASTPTCGA